MGWNHRCGDWKEPPGSFQSLHGLSANLNKLCAVRLNYTLLLLRQRDVAAAPVAAQEALDIAQSRDPQELGGYPYINPGHVFLAKKQYAGAFTAYEQALAIRQKLEQACLLMEKRAGLAQLGLATEQV